MPETEQQSRLDCMTMTMKIHLSQPVRLIIRLNLTQVQHAFCMIRSLNEASLTVKAVR